MPKLYFKFGDDKVKKIEICCDEFETLVRLNKWGIYDQNMKYVNKEKEGGDGDGKVREFHVYAEGKESLRWKTLKFCYGCAEKIEFILINVPPPSPN